MKVLVAEDNPTMQIMVGGILKRWGHEPVTAVDGEEACTAFSDGMLCSLLPH